MQLDELYRQVIMDHYMHPRNQGAVEDAGLTIHLKNPTCGDEISLQLILNEGIVEDVRFAGTGCSISLASASMMTEAIKGKKLAEALRISQEFRKLLKGEEVDPDVLGDLEALGGVSKFPARIKCATLAWNALERGKDRKGGTENEPTESGDS